MPHGTWTTTGGGDSGKAVSLEDVTAASVAKILDACSRPASDADRAYARMELILGGASADAIEMDAA